MYSVRHNAAWLNPNGQSIQFCIANHAKNMSFPPPKSLKNSKTRQFQRFSAFCNEKNILGLGVN
jgi:hypothetical protein